LRLRDARGGRLRTTDLRGRPYALTFLYTNCPDVCPLIGQELRQALELLGQQADGVTVAAVSVDPEGDTAEVVQLWLRRMQLPANFRYLIGTERQLKPLWSAYFAAPQRPGVEQSLHTASIWLIDARGRWRTKFSGGVPVAPADLAHDLRVLLRENPH
jgi:protein SCO1/2